MAVMATYRTLKYISIKGKKFPGRSFFENCIKLPCIQIGFKFRLCLLQVLIKKHSEKFSLDQMVPESVRKQLSAGEEESNGLYMNGSANGVAGDIMQ